VTARTIEWAADLTDGVVTVRRLRPEDAAAYVRGFADDPALGTMIGTETDPTVAEIGAQARDERPGHVPALAIADPETDRFLGGIGIYRLDLRHRRGEVGFWLVPDARGRGLGSRATRLLTDWAFGTLGLDRMEMTTTPDNAATRALASKLGFAEEGTMRERNFERGRRVDVMMFAVLREEWAG
jgi:RimJ/RimL family protein N-acetyltransferase